jgi:hypothetical protein
MFTRLRIQNSRSPTFEARTIGLRRRHAWEGALKTRPARRALWSSAAIMLVVAACSSAGTASPSTATTLDATPTPTATATPTVPPTASPTPSPTPALKTIQDLLNSPHPATKTTAVVAAIHAAFAVDPSVTLKTGTNPVTEVAFIGHPATPGFKETVGVSIVCTPTSGPCGVGFLYACAKNGHPWDSIHSDLNRYVDCEMESIELFWLYQATGHDAFYDATLKLYNYSIRALPTRAALIKAYLAKYGQ